MEADAASVSHVAVSTGLTATMDIPTAVLMSAPKGPEPKSASESSHRQTAEGPSARPLLTLSHEPPTDQSSLERQGEASLLMQHIEKIVLGKTKYSWPDRSDSLKALANAVSQNQSEAASLLTIERLNTLASKIGEHLEELRPSIISSTLQLTNAIIKSSIPSNEFIASVMPYVVTVACEHSLKANDAVYTLILALDKHPSPRLLVSNISNISRLEKVVHDYMKHRGSSDDADVSAERALQYIVQKDPGINQSASTPVTHMVLPLSLHDKGSIVEKSDVETQTVPSLEVRSDKGIAHETTPVPEPDNRGDIQRSVDRVRSLRLSRMSWRAKLESPALSSRSKVTTINDPKMNSGVPDNFVPVDTKQIPYPSFHGRAYSKDEVEEIRQTAIEAVIEKLESEHREERDRIQKEKVDTERELEKERSDNSELRSVLEEYEVTMKQMVSQINSQFSAHQTALESENTRLKSELQGTSEAFDKLKEKYETTKQTVERMETKEGRLVEQIQELKKNMVELQNWSNDLKANSEKKLTQAFESVTSYKAMYIDKEAHERKAVSDAAKLKLELERSTENLHETVGKLSHCEGELHKEQDARADLAGQLSSAKATILRLTTQRETSQQKLDQNIKVIGGMKQRLGELEGMLARMGDAKKQLDLMRIERQELKARAFDDMKRIESLERELNMKDKELEEMNAICDQAVGELERWKHAQST